MSYIIAQNGTETDRLSLSQAGVDRLIESSSTSDSIDQRSYLRVVFLHSLAVILSITAGVLAGRQSNMVASR